MITCSCSTIRIRLSGRRGLSMIEVVASITIVSVMLVSAINMVGAAGASMRSMALRTTGILLAEQLMSEILQQSYEEPDGPPNFGREGGEGGEDRAERDDVDDYDGWSSSPPEYKDGTEIPGLEGWRRSVTVEWVQPENLMQVVGTESGVKRITVTVTYNDVLVSTLVAIRTDVGGDG